MHFAQKIIVAQYGMAGRFERRDGEKSQSLVKGRPIFIKSSSNYFETKTISESDFSFDFMQSVL